MQVAVAIAMPNEDCPVYVKKGVEDRWVDRRESIVYAIGTHEHPWFYDDPDALPFE